MLTLGRVMLALPRWRGRRGGRGGDADASATGASNGGDSASATEREPIASLFWSDAADYGRIELERLGSAIYRGARASAVRHGLRAGGWWSGDGAAGGGEVERAVLAR